VLGPHHPDVAISLTNLAMLYYEKGEYCKAEPLFKRSFAVNEKALGTDNPCVAISLNNLEGLHFLQGDYSKAEFLFNRSLAIREKALRPDHPDVANSLNSLAVLYKKGGDYSKAEPLFNRSLAISQKALSLIHCSGKPSGWMQDICLEDIPKFTRAPLLLSSTAFKLHATDLRADVFSSGSI